MTAKDIKGFLAERYSKTHAFFMEFRPFTGYAGNVNQIDAVAVGLYDKDDRIIAFEIKVNRGDFVSDVSQFSHKHKFALEFSHEFYYVSPWGLIDKSEVPEVAGLMYVNKGNRISKKKQAMRRNYDSVPLHYFQAFARNFGTKLENALVPIKYLGKEWTQDDFKKEIEAEHKRFRSYWVNKEVEDKVEEKLSEESFYISVFEELRKDAGFVYRDREGSLSGIKELIKRGRLFNEALRSYKNFKRDLDSAFKGFE